MAFNMARICVSLLVIPTVFIATASAALPPVGDTHCTESAATCPSNSKCDITVPCKWGTTCSCNTGYEQYYNVTTFIQYCVPETALVGETCDSTVQCSGVRTYCNGVGVCTCNADTTVNSAKTDCTRPVLLLGQNCTRFPNDCGYFATCLDTRCQCAPGYKAFNTTDCTHYEPGEVCPTDECDEAVCAFGTCQSGEFHCTKGMKWYSVDVDTNLVDGVCVPNEDWIVGQGQYCEANVWNFQATANRLCGHDLACGACPEQPSIKRCLGNGASVVVTSAVMLIASLVLLMTL